MYVVCMCVSMRVREYLYKIYVLFFHSFLANIRVCVCVCCSVDDIIHFCCFFHLVLLCFYSVRSSLLKSFRIRKWCIRLLCTLFCHLFAHHHHHSYTQLCRLGFLQLLLYVSYMYIYIYIHMQRIIIERSPADLRYLSMCKHKQKLQSHSSCSHPLCAQNIYIYIIITIQNIRDRAWFCR